MRSRAREKYENVVVVVVAAVAAVVIVVVNYRGQFGCHIEYDHKAKRAPRCFMASTSLIQMGDTVELTKRRERVNGAESARVRVVTLGA